MSRPRPSGASSRNARHSTMPRASTAAIPGLPPYEPPKHPLNPSAHNALRNLSSAHQGFGALKKHQSDAIEALGDSAVLINDRLHDRTKKHKRRDEELANGLAKENLSPESRIQIQHQRRDAAQELGGFKTAIDGMTERMDDSIRKMIDGREAMTQLEDSLKKARELVQSAGGQVSTQQSSTQRTNRRRRQRDEDEDEDEEFEPTLPDETQDARSDRNAQCSISDIFRHDLQRQIDAYRSLPLSVRYADHNDYVHFKKMVHDGRYHDDVDMPHASTWFVSENRAPEPGVTTRRGAVEAADDSDDDIVVARQTVSTKCPLTLREFVEPVTSSKCPHSFERSAIMDMISASTITSGGGTQRGVRGGKKAVQCPVTGCQQNLTADDLQADPIIIRRIKRLQQARTAEEEGSDEEGSRFDRPQIESTIIHSEADYDVSGIAPKPEPVCSFGSRTGGGAPPPSTAISPVVDLGDGTDEDEGSEPNQYDEGEEGDVELDEA